MKCPKCNVCDMTRKPLKDAVDKGVVKVDKDEDFPQSEMDELIENSNFALCQNCGFSMMPEKE